MIFILICTIIVLIISWWFIWFQYVKSYFPNCAGPTPVPLVGNALDFFSNTTGILPTLMQYYEKYGDMVFMTFANEPLLLTSDVKFLEYLLTSSTLLEKSKSYQFLDKWLGKGLLMADGGERWKKHRKILTPAFHFKILERFVETFDSTSNILVEKLRKDVDKDSVDVYPLMNVCTLDVICETAMGTTVNALENPDSDYIMSVKKMCKIFVDRSFSAIQQFGVVYRFTKNYQDEQKCLKLLHDYTMSVIKKKKENFQYQKVDEEDEFGKRRKMAFLDIMLQANANGQDIKDEFIREEVDTFLFAGHDTTATAVSFAIYCLSKYQDIQKRVVEEIKSIFEDDMERIATYRDLQEMKYLEMVIKETLRLYPPVPAYARTIKKDTKYYGGVLPSRLTILCFAYGLHRNPRIYPDPEKFDPERFTADNQASRNPFSFIPFSAGPRNCIGQKYAMLEMKSIISKILRTFEVLPAIPVHEPLVVAEVVLKSANGIRVRLRKRKN